MEQDLKILLCGEADSESDLGEILTHIGNTLSLVIGQIPSLLESSEQQMSLYGPFIGRSILELGCTAIIGRLDPFRVLVLREVQRQSDYNISTRNRISIQWQGDVVAKQKIPNLWSDKNMTEITRALVGDYYDHIFWRSAIDKLIDTVPSGRGGEWFGQMRGIGGRGFCSSARGTIQACYSSLSKGLHYEFVIPPESLFDRSTVTDLIRESLFVIASFGLAMTQIPHIPYGISLDRAMNIYENVQEMEIR